MGATWLNVGSVGEFTVTVIVAVEAHCPAVGVNVYNVVAVLLLAGDHVPVIPFNEVVGNENISPEQIEAIWVKVGVTIGFIVIDNVVELAH
jgi:hypothetical protein